MKKELRNNIISMEKGLDYIEIKFDISNINDNELLNQIKDNTFINDTVIYYYEKGMARAEVMAKNNSLIDLWYNDFLETVFKTDYVEYNKVLKDLYFDIKCVGDLIAIKEGFEELNY